MATVQDRTHAVNGLNDPQQGACSGPQADLRDPGRLDLRGAVIGDRLDRLLLDAPDDPAVGDAGQQQPAVGVAQCSHSARDGVTHLLLVLDRRRFRAHLPYQGADSFDRDVRCGGIKQRLSGCHLPIILRGHAPVRGFAGAASVPGRRGTGAGALSADGRI